MAFLNITLHFLRQAADTNMGTAKYYITRRPRSATSVGVRRNLCITHVEKCGPLYSHIRCDMLRVAFRPDKSSGPEFAAVARIIQCGSRSVEKPVSGRFRIWNFCVPWRFPSTLGSPSPSVSGKQ